jgi:MAF protein
MKAVPDPATPLVLGSASPRRRELLSCLGLRFEVVASDVDETFVAGIRAEAQARRLAIAKAMAIAAGCPDAVVLAADTIVVHRGAMLAKPADGEEARRMLRTLRGRVHRVITGVALVAPGRGSPRVLHNVSRVRMRAYSDADIEDTIARGVPFDKAGGYGIQDAVLRPVEACEGCFCNVMGLPLWRTARLLQDAGFEVTTEALPERCLTCPDRPPG